MRAPAIDTHGLSRRFGSKVAVADLSLSIPRGEIFGFLGPNGAGKTTSVKLLLALVAPSGGAGTVLGAPIGNREARRRIGFLPEHFRFHDSLTGRELLRFHGRLYGARGDALECRLDALLGRVDLLDAANRPLREYSKGMVQRIGLAQALLNDPELAEIVLGKWLAYWLLVAFYILLTAGGVILAVWAVSAIVSGGSGFVPPNTPLVLALILLEATVMLTISIAGGTRFSTVTNGMVALGIFGLGFLGGWVEMIGVMLVEGEAGRQAIRNIGTIISLIVPADALWRLAAYYMLPSIARDLALTPFSSMYPPSGAMVLWAIAHIVAVGVIAVRQFNNRTL